jgi:hypothetical protein
VAVFPADALTAEELTKAARIALTAAGANGDAVTAAWTLDLPPKRPEPEEGADQPAPPPPKRRKKK